MPKINKKKIITDWVKRIKQDSNVFCRQFMKADELYNLFISTDEDVHNLHISTFIRNVNSIVRNDTKHNLKRKLPLKRKPNDRSVYYIIVGDSEKNKDVYSIHVYKTRKKNKQIQHIQSTKKTNTDSCLPEHEVHVSSNNPTPNNKPTSITFRD